MRERSKPERLAEQLRTRIAAGGLEPGSHLGTKTALCNEYDIALSTLNETLSILKADGLVRVRTGPGGGVTIADSPPLVRLGRKLLQLDGAATDVAECLLIRNAIEPLIVQQATMHASENDIGDLRSIAERMRKDNADDLAFLRLNVKLHERIAYIIPDGLLRSMYLGVLGFVDEHTVGVIADPDTQDRIQTRLDVHIDLVEAIASADLAEAKAAEHVHRSFTEHTLTEAERTLDR